MAKFTISSILVLLSLVPLTTTSAHNNEFLLQCTKEIGSHCGIQMYEKIFDDENFIVNDECCSKIAAMGHSCNDKLTERVLQTNPEFAKESHADFLARSQRVFNECVQVSKVADPKVRQCLLKIGSCCGLEVKKSLVNDENNVSENCCGKLTSTGRSCHLRIVKYLLQNDPEIRKMHPGEALKNAIEMFRKCRLDY